MYGSGIGTGAGATALGVGALSTGSLMLAVFAGICLLGLAVNFGRLARSSTRP